MTLIVRTINALWIIVYCLIITTAFGLQIFMNEQPCPLCYLQRVAMLLVCTAAAMNLKFGIRVYHYALTIIACLVGGTIALRQILLHICPQFTKFGEPFWGLSLYTWSFLTFIGSLIVCALLLALYRPAEREARPINLLEKSALIWLALIICGNMVSTLIDCGLSGCHE